MTESTDAERYVAGTLSQEEAARFEEAMIERPALAADVNVRRRIKAGLALLEQRDELAPLLEAPAPRTQHLRFAAAAAVLVLAVGLWSTWRGGPSTPMQALLSPSEVGTEKIAASFTLVRTRSGDSPTYPVKRDEGLVQFRIFVGDPTAAPFVVRLVAEKSPGAAPFKESSISKITDGFGEVYLDPRKLESGEYTLSLTPQSGDEQLFPFTLQVSP